MLTWAESPSELFWSPVVLRPFVHKLFTYSSSLQQPLGQFQPNLIQSILVWRGINFIKTKGHTFFQGEIITEKQKYIADKIQNSKIFFSRTTGPILTKLGTKHPWKKGIQICSSSNGGPHPFPKGDNYEIAKNRLTKFENLLKNHCANFNQT